MRKWRKFQVLSGRLEAEERFAFTNRVGRTIQSSVDLPSVSLSSVHSFSVSCVRILLSCGKGNFFRASRGVLQRG
jgi:hypothetical protein